MPKITKLRHNVELRTIYSKTWKIICDMLISTLWHTISSLEHHNSSSLISACIVRHDGLGRTISSQGRRNGSGRPAGCRTNDLTSKNFYVHIISIFENVSWFYRIYAIRRQILMLQWTKFYFRLGSAPDPLDWFKAPTSKGREAKIEGRGRMVSGGKNEGPTTTKG